MIFFHSYGAGFQTFCKFWVLLSLLLLYPCLKNHHGITLPCVQPYLAVVTIVSLNVSCTLASKGQAKHFLNGSMFRTLKTF